MSDDAVIPIAPDEPPGRWVPRLDAPALLGISERTMDRQLRDGRLRRRHGPTGSVQVWIPDPSPPATVTSQRQDMAALASQLTGALVPLVEHLAAQEQTIVRQAAALAVQAQTLDRQEAELAALRVALAAATHPPWWRRWWRRWRG